jgi:hypothetical protein
MMNLEERVKALEEQSNIKNLNVEEEEEVLPAGSLGIEIEEISGLTPEPPPIEAPNIEIPEIPEISSGVDFDEDLSNNELEGMQGVLGTQISGLSQDEKRIPTLRVIQVPEEEIKSRSTTGITWKQSKLWIALFPPFDEDNIFITRSQLPNTDRVKSASKAFEAIQERGADIPPETFDEWVSWFPAFTTETKKVKVELQPIEVEV